MSTVNVPIPSNAVQVLREGSSVDAMTKAWREVFDAVRTAHIVQPDLPEGAVYVDEDGDIWVVNVEGKLGLVATELTETTSIHFTKEAEFTTDGMSVWGLDLTCVHWPGEA